MATQIHTIRQYRKRGVVSFRSLFASAPAGSSLSIHGITRSYSAEGGEPGEEPKRSATRWLSLLELTVYAGGVVLLA